MEGLGGGVTQGQHPPSFKAEMPTPLIHLSSRIIVTQHPGSVAKKTVIKLSHVGERGGGCRIRRKKKKKRGAKCQRRTGGSRPHKVSKWETTDAGRQVWPEGGGAPGEGLSLL